MAYYGAEEVKDAKEAKEEEKNKKMEAKEARRTIATGWTKLPGGGLRGGAGGAEPIEEAMEVGAIKNNQPQQFGHICHVNYLKCGEEVDLNQAELKIEATGRVKLKYDRLQIENHIEDVCQELTLKYCLQDFQIETIVQLVQGNNVVLVSPTGSGKSVVIAITVRVMEILKEESVVAFGSEPIQNIIKEKMVEPILPSGSIGMAGRTEVSEEGGEVDMSHCMEELKSGRIKIIYGYQESWSHKIGQEIIENAADDDKIGFLFFDEGHQNLLWGGWRKEMMMGPSEMRQLAGQPPVLVMSATLTKDDMKNISSCAGIKDFVSISRSPVLNNIKFVNIRRPTNQNKSGLAEDDDGNTIVGEGLLQPIMMAFLGDFCMDIENNVEPKTCMVFGETEDLIRVQTYLYDRLGDAGRNRPWVFINADTGSVTKRRMRSRTRKSQIYLYLCTSTLMLGVDFPRVDVVLLCRPMPHLHSLLQAAGRGGRVLESGRRRRVVVYQMWNRQDTVIGMKNLEEEVKNFCEEESCLAAFLHHFFCGDMHSFVHRDIDNNWCCGNCDGDV